MTLQHRPVRSTPPAACQQADLLGRIRRLSLLHWPQIAARIQETVVSCTPAGSPLLELVDYQLGSGGKRIRALVPLLVAEALGVEPERLQPFSAACELLHNATLVHDDLQDGDEVRRGQPTVWRKFGANRAIDLGDAMMFYATLLLGELDVSPTMRLDITRQLMRDTITVIDGQEREFALLREDAPTRQAYLEMITGKTAALLVLPIVGAARLCGQPPAVLAALQQAAGELGVLFQIQDDVLDLYGEKGRGEPGSDIREGKRSLLVVSALQRLSEPDAAWLLGVLDAPREQTTAADIERAGALFVTCGAYDDALGELRARQQRALAAVRQTEHPGLIALIEALSVLFLHPIRHLL